MMRRFLLSLATCLPTLYTMAQDGLWSTVSKSSLQTYLNGRSAVSPAPSNYELVKLNRNMLQQLQQQAPLVKPGERSSVSPVRISLPLPISGQSLSSAFTESPVLSDALAKQLTNFKTYELKDPVTRSLQGRLTITSQGVTGLIFTDNGSAYISPVSPDFPDVHMVYYVKDIPLTKPTLCGVKELVDGTGAANRIQTTLAGDCQLRNYRLAIAATGEYTAWAGSQAQALVYIGTLVNDVTAIYERDASITFTLVSNNSIIFTDAATDPYFTVPFPTAGDDILDPDNTLLTNQNTLNSNIGNGNYDEGLVLSNDWDGGLAFLGVVCNNTYKGRGAAGLTFGAGSNPTLGPQGPVFIGTVAHEMAHQFNVTHTMAATNGGCAGNGNPATAYEPGGGSTIMAYAGVCTGNAYQNNSDLYFHSGSILQMANYAINSATCVTPVAMSNSAPTVSVAAASYTIPVSTPFMLTATGTDANNNTLYYSWEQMNAGDTSTALPSAAATSGPNFRSYPPTTSNTRIFPRMADILNGAATTYEVLPGVTRAMSFQVMVRDAATGGGCTAQTTVTVNTNAAAGAFTVTSQNTATNWVANGSNTVNITWSVASTNAAPINCSNVDILLSIDGGVTYTDTLAANTTNDGTETITIPSLPTATGRIMVKARGNIFFNINAANIIITSSCSANGSTFTPGTSVIGVAGNSTLDLSLSPNYGTPVSISGQLASTDPASILSVYNTSTSSCAAPWSNTYRYDTYRFTPSVSGSYTFARNVGTSGLCIFNLYSGDFNPSSPCDNFINSSGRWPGGASSVSTGNSYTATLNAGQFYTMAVGTFNSNTNSPVLPANYTINVTPPVGGALLSSAPNPGAGFSYTYVIVDNATGLIKAIDASSDLSNASIYPTNSDYTVYGLSYSNAVSATLTSYVGTSFAAFRNALLYNPATLCGNVSANNLLVTVTAALSVQMLPLSAYKTGNTVNLKWATASEQNSSHFEIWRSADGNNFDKLIGTVAAQGNSSLKANYELNDNAPLTEWNYYRVKQFDKDGHSTLGSIARVNMQQSNATLSIYPNPVKSSLTLEYYSTSIETVRLRVLNSMGNLIYQSGFTTQNGTNLYTIPAGNFSKGIYVVQLVSDSGSITERFVKE
ncbi:MAG TPA: M12 family metallo-peptidase [Niastella sp.]